MRRYLCWIFHFALALCSAPLSALQSAIELPVTLEDECPMEYCGVGEWATTFDSLVVFESHDLTSPRAFVIPARSTFEADSTIVIVSQLGMVLVDEDHAGRFPRPGRSYVAGDTIHLIQYQGEDFWLANHRGETIQLEGFWSGTQGMVKPVGTRFFGGQVQETRDQWWVRVNLNGESGWFPMRYDVPVDMNAR